MKYGANYLDDLANSPIGFLIGKIESRNDYGTYNYKHTELNLEVVLTN